MSRTQVFPVAAESRAWTRPGSQIRNGQPSPTKAAVCVRPISWVIEGSHPGSWDNRGEHGWFGVKRPRASVMSGGRQVAIGSL